MPMILQKVDLWSSIGSKCKINIKTYNTGTDPTNLNVYLQNISGQSISLTMFIYIS